MAEDGAHVSPMTEKHNNITQMENIDEKSHGKHVAGSALLIDKHGGVRKLPVPTNNPNGKHELLLFL